MLGGLGPYHQHFSGLKLHFGLFQDCFQPAKTYCYWFKIWGLIIMHFFKSGGALAPLPLASDAYDPHRQHSCIPTAYYTVITSLDKPHQTWIHAGGHRGLETKLV